MIPLGLSDENTCRYLIDRPFDINSIDIIIATFVIITPAKLPVRSSDCFGSLDDEDDDVIEDIIAARRVHRADIVIPFMHWGWEDEPDPSPRLRAFARRMIDAGADLVVGGHPHVTQGAEYYRGKPIIYSLGNFLFNGFDTPATTTGWVLSARVDRTDVVDWRTHVARLDANGVPHPDPTASSPCASPDRKTINQCAGE